MGEQHRFIWPPRASRVPPVSNLTPPPSTPAPAEPWWRHVETTFLGLTDEPLADRCARAGWAPDDPDDYCARCGSSVGPFEATPAPDLGDLAAGHDGPGPSCPACRNRRLAWSRAVRLGSYEGELREMIHQVKFQRWRRLGADLGGMLAVPLRRALVEAGLDPAHAAVVPVPMSFRRRWVRGIDHTLVIARAAAGALACPVIACLRRQHRPTQWSVPPGQRRSNVRGAFTVRTHTLLRLAGRTMILLDDLRTTGATLTECCRAVDRAQRALAPEARSTALWTAVLAVTPPPNKSGTSGRTGGREHI